MSMPFFNPAERPARRLFPGVTAQCAWGDNVMMCFVQFEHADAVVPEHSHPHEQMGTGLDGEFELVIDGEARVIRPGDGYLVPGGTVHSARSIGGPARALDIFSPVREEYKEGSL